MVPRVPGPGRPLSVLSPAVPVSGHSPSEPARHLLLTFDFPPMGGGIARWMSELAKRYPPDSLLISSGRRPGSESHDATYPNRVDRLNIAARRLRTLRGLAGWSGRAERLSRTESVEFVWSGQILPAGYPARWVRARTGIPYGITVHGGDLIQIQSRMMRPRKRLIVRTLFRNASVIVANSRWTASQYRRLCDRLWCRGLDERVRVVPLGTDPQAFRPDLDSSRVRDAYRLPEGRWLLTVARLVPHKGIDTGIRCLASLAEENPKLRYLVVGTGSDKARLEALAEDLQVRDRVHFVGEAPDTDLPALYGVGDIYLGPSRLQDLNVEGFGISILEASASGLPVVVGRSGGTADAAQEGKTGLLADPEDPRAFAVAVRSMLEDVDRAKRMGQEGRRAVKTFYNWDRVVETMQEIGRECASTVRARPATTSVVGPG